MCDDEESAYGNGKASRSKDCYSLSCKEASFGDWEIKEEEQWN